MVLNLLDETPRKEKGSEIQQAGRARPQIPNLGIAFVQLWQPWGIPTGRAAGTQSCLRSRVVAGLALSQGEVLRSRVVPSLLTAPGFVAVNYSSQNTLLHQPWSDLLAFMTQISSGAELNRLATETAKER